MRRKTYSCFDNLYTAGIFSDDFFCLDIEDNGHFLPAGFNVSDDVNNGAVNIVSSSVEWSFIMMHYLGKI